MSNEEHYSDLLTQLSGLSRELSLFCGFTFTTITILVTWLPDPNTFLAQISLFFLSVLFDLFMFLLAWVMVMRTIFVRYLPLQKIRGSNIFNPLLFLSFGLWRTTLVLIFLLTNQIYISLASAITGVIMISISYIFLWKQFQEHYGKTDSI